MAKIMSLIYREWILMRKKLLLGLAVTAGLLLLITFIGFSYQNGAFDGNEKLCNLGAARAIGNGHNDLLTLGIVFHNGLVAREEVRHNEEANDGDRNDCRERYQRNGRNGIGLLL